MQHEINNLLKLDVVINFFKRQIIVQFGLIEQPFIYLINCQQYGIYLFFKTEYFTLNLKIKKVKFIE